MDMTYEEYTDYLIHFSLQELVDFDYVLGYRASTTDALEIL